MALNYARLAQVAQKLITENGRSVTFVKLAETAADPNRPWEGTSDAETLVVATAVITRYAKEDVDGEIVRRGDMRAVVDELSVTPNSIEDFDLLRDDENQEWKIVDVVKFRPGPTTLAYVLQLRK